MSEVLRLQVVRSAAKNDGGVASNVSVACKTKSTYSFFACVRP
ncbi:class III lanthipeptide [Carnobacterium maltaromaticum]|nr:class III lanthipeptide [Carnobacterium maltaromaticum]